MQESKLSDVHACKVPRWVIQKCLNFNGTRQAHIIKAHQLKQQCHSCNRSTSGLWCTPGSDVHNAALGMLC
jgi:hypothetical protein